MGRAEKLTIALFTATALLWIFRADITIGASFRLPGWASLFPAAKAINDSTVALVMAFVGFLLPVGGGKRLIGWEEFKRAPWEILILFGGGYALADGFEASGFSKWCGERRDRVGHDAGDGGGRGDDRRSSLLPDAPRGARRVVRVHAPGRDGA
jgi:sodium-dependent dicarboxylate transporter 2/3/5